MDPVLHKCKAVVPGVGRSGSGPYSTGRGLTEKRATTTRGAGSTQLSKYSPYIHPLPHLQELELQELHRVLL